VTSALVEITTPAYGLVDIVPERARVVSVRKGHVRHPDVEKVAQRCPALLDLVHEQPLGGHPGTHGVVVP
jgi:hypothetical protein